MFAWSFNIAEHIRNIGVLGKALGAVGTSGAVILIASSIYTDKAVGVLENKHDTYVKTHAEYEKLAKKTLEEGNADVKVYATQLMRGMEIQNQNMFALQQALITGQAQHLKPLKFKKPALEPEPKGE